MAQRESRRSTLGRLYRKPETMDPNQKAAKQTIGAKCTQLIPPASSRNRLSRKTCRWNCWDPAPIRPIEETGRLIKLNSLRSTVLCQFLMSLAAESCRSRRSWYTCWNPIYNGERAERVPTLWLETTLQETARCARWCHWTVPFVFSVRRLRGFRQVVQHV